MTGDRVIRSTTAAVVCAVAAFAAVVSYSHIYGLGRDHGRSRDEGRAAGPRPRFSVGQPGWRRHSDTPPTVLAGGVPMSHVRHGALVSSAQTGHAVAAAAAAL